MKQNKTRTELLQHLQDSLGVMEVNINAFWGGYTECWMPVVTELHKLLCDDHNKATPRLIQQLFPELKLHPLLGTAKPGQVKWLMNWPIKMLFSGEQGFIFELLNFEGQKIGIPEWLEQGLWVSEDTLITIEKFIIRMRHNEAAHILAAELRGEAKAAQGGLVKRSNGFENPAFKEIAIEIASYIVGLLRQQPEILGFRRTAAPKIPKSALPYLKKGDETVEVANSLNQEEKQYKLIEALDSYQAALFEIIPDNNKLTFSAIFFDMAKTYASIAEMQHLSPAGRYAFVHRALYAFEIATICSPAENEPVMHAMLLNNTATTLMTLEEIDPDVNLLQAALESLTEAASICDESQNADVFARAQHNISTCLVKIFERNKDTGDAEKHLSEAFEHIQIALRIRENMDDKAGYAMSIMTRGNISHYIYKKNNSVVELNKALDDWMVAKKLYEAIQSPIAITLQNWVDSYELT